MTQKRRTKKFLEGGHSITGKYPRGTKKFKAHDEDGPVVPPSGMRKQHLYANKNYDYGYVGTNHKYLRRFLRSRVGQDWNDVFSEICESADARTFEGNHLREWLEFSVDVKTRMENGKVVDHLGHDVTLTFYRDAFYVHPETNKLEKAPPQKRGRWQESIPKSVFELEGQLFHEHDGIWYRVMMEETRKYKNRWGHMVYSIAGDAFLKVERPDSYWGIERQLRGKYGYSPEGKVWHCVHKESANSKEIAKLKKLLSQQNKAA